MNTKNKKELIVFFLNSYIFTWIIWIIAAVNESLRNGLIIAGSFIPSLTAVAVLIVSFL